MKIQQYKMHVIANRLNAAKHGGANRLSKTAQNWVLSAYKTRLKNKKA